mgnify:CR=1 FL=1
MTGTLIVRHPVTDYAASTRVSALATNVNTTGAARPGILEKNRTPGNRLADVTDGLSNTLFVGEISNHKTLAGADMVGYRKWHRGFANGADCAPVKNVAQPINSTTYNGSNNFNDISLGSNHVGGTQILMGDGVTRFISENIDMSVLLSISSRNGDEAVTNLPSD